MPNEQNAPVPDDESIDEPVEVDDNAPAGDDDTVAPVDAAADPVAEAEGFGRLTPRERQVAEWARSQEKTKLYAEQNRLKTRLRELETAQAPSNTPRSGQSQSTRSARDAEIDRIHATLAELSKGLRAKDVREYRRDKIADLTRRGVGFVESLIQGDSEELIDASIQLAMAEHELKEAEFRVKYGISGNGGVAPAPRPAPVVIRQSAPRRPEGVPSVVSAGVGGDSSDVLTTEQINVMASPEAVRDGTYAANRDRIIRAMKTGRVRIGG
jgi:hypothetical protein